MVGKRLLLLLGLVTLSPGSVRGHGGLPEAQGFYPSPDDAQTLFLPTTFGLLKSVDGGESFDWVCDTAIGYQGSFVPRYAMTSNGDIYATTFEGLRVSEDGACSFTNIGGNVGPDKFVSDVEVGPDDRIWASTSTAINPKDPNPNDIWVSAAGETFTSAGLTFDDRWWLSLEVAPGDGERVYVSGYTPQGTETPAVAHLRRRTADEGEWEVLPVDDFVFAEGSQPLIYLLGVSPTDPDIVYARAVSANPPLGDAVYRSLDGGLNWTKVLDLADAVQGFLIRADGTVMVGTFYACADEDPEEVKGCVRTSGDDGETWDTPDSQIRMTCLGEGQDGTLYACGTNWEPDNAALAKSTDNGESWTKVYRFVETAGPLECPSETVQATECAANKWEPLCESLGICAAPADAGASAADGGLKEEDPPGGCCRAGGRNAPDWLSVLLLLLGMSWMTFRRSSIPK